MPSVVACPAVVFQFLNNQGAPAVNGTLLTQVGGVNYPTYSDSAGTVPLPNPIPLNSRGEVSTAAGATSQLFVVENTVYQFTLSDAAGNLLWSEPYVNGVTTTALDSTNLHYDLSSAEAAASVTPTAYNYLWLDPLRYGAVGDGVTDDTGALNSMIAVMNVSTNPIAEWTEGLTYLCQPLNPITANNLTLKANGCTIKAKAASWISTTSHIQLTGNGARITDLTCDGNQSAFTASTGDYMLKLSGANIRMARVSVKNSIASGLGVWGNNIRGTDCHFDSCAGLGAEFIIASYCHFEDCTCNYDGYGLNNTLATNAFVAFGLAIRFQSHHITFTGCDALQNGRDGFNVNQGSYAIKFIGCLAWMNGDGGFTAAADNTSTGNPGEGQSPYDCEYVDCEAYNNYSSGLAAYSPVINFTVLGGRYYDNSSVVGVQTIQSSYIAGCYFAAGSVGINVQTKAYDDRQLCTITNVTSSGSNATLTATNWVAGTMADYPRVKILDNTLTFQGYGTISAETTGSVTIGAAGFNPVTLANITSGWAVTQRVQDIGVFFDNNVQGQMDVDGFGFLPGYFGFSGFKSVSGYNANGQNVLVPQYTLDPNNELLVNPTFDGSVANWVYSDLGSGGTFTQYTSGLTQYLLSAGSAQMVGGSMGGIADAALTSNAIYAASAVFLEATVFVNAVTAGDASLVVFWAGSSNATTLEHPGGGWKKLTVGIFTPPGQLGIGFRLACITATTVYFDTCSFRVRSDPTDGRDFFYPSRNLPV